MCPLLGEAHRLEAEVQRIRIAVSDVEAPGRGGRDIETVAGGAQVERRVEGDRGPHQHLDRLPAAVERADLARDDLADRGAAEERDRVLGALGQAIDRLVRRETPAAREVRDLGGQRREELDVERPRRAPAKPQLALAGIRLDPQRERASGVEPGRVEHAPHAPLAAFALEREAEVRLLGEQPARGVAQPEPEARRVDLDAGLVAREDQRRRVRLAPCVAALLDASPFARGRDRGGEQEGETRPVGEPLHR